MLTRIMTILMAATNAWPIGCSASPTFGQSQPISAPTIKAATICAGSPGNFLIWRQSGSYR